MTLAEFSKLNRKARNSAFRGEFYLNGEYTGSGVYYLNGTVVIVRMANDGSGRPEEITGQYNDPKQIVRCGGLDLGYAYVKYWTIK